MLASLIAGLASGETVAAIRRARRAAAFYMAAAVLAVVGLMFLLVAAYVWAARRFGPIEAALAFGGGFIVLSLVTLAIHRVTSGYRARRQAQQRNSDLMKVAVATGIAVLPTLLRGKVGMAALVAPAIAAVAYAIYRENTGRHPTDDDPE